VDVLAALGAEGDVSFRGVEGFSADTTFINAEDRLSVFLEAVFEESRGLADEIYSGSIVSVYCTPEMAIQIVTFVHCEAAVKIGDFEACNLIAHTALY
jgi:hypothetical protein